MEELELQPVSRGMQFLQLDDELGDISETDPPLQFEHLVSDPGLEQVPSPERQENPPTRGNTGCRRRSVACGMLMVAVAAVVAVTVVLAMQLSPAHEPAKEWTPTLANSWPGNGETGVAVTRETVVDFDQPLIEPPSPAVLNVTVLAPVQPWPVRLHWTRAFPARVTLFFMRQLPSNTDITVLLHGQRGTEQFAFRTLSTQPVLGTAACGRVFASQLDASRSNTPLAGVTITVDGQPSVVAVTDALGNFEFPQFPAGRVFVHINGSTAVVAGGRGYWPTVGKAWETLPGQLNRVGTIYLPLVPADTLQSVSANHETQIKMAPEVTADRPELADVFVVVPPDSLYSDNGDRGGRVGIAPVDPARLPGELPQFLDFGLVITVQTDGPTNFDFPVPACFPNLPTAKRGLLPPGGSSALVSFNHDTGRFEVVGPMTVVGDGRLVCTDPGVGIRAPGWHGQDPVCSANDQKPPDDDPHDGCNEKLAKKIDEAGYIRAVCNQGIVVDSACVVGVSVWSQQLGKLLQQLMSKIFGDETNRRLLPPALSETYPDPETNCNQAPDMSECRDRASDCWRKTHGIRRRDSAENTNDMAPLPLVSAARAKAILLWNETQKLISMLRSVATAMAAREPVSNDTIDSLGRELDRLSSDQATCLADIVTARQLGFDQLGPVAGLWPTVTDRFHFVVVRGSDGSAVMRGVTDTGVLPPLILQPQTGYEVHMYVPASARFAVTAFITGPSGSTTNVPRKIMLDVFGSSSDVDSDGLTDAAEGIIGTRADLNDTDADGIIDGLEVKGGTNPLDALPSAIGLTSITPTAGLVVDVCTSDGALAVADTVDGLVVFNIFRSLSPVRVFAQGGSASAVACTTDSFAALIRNNVVILQRELTVPQTVPLNCDSAAIAMFGNVVLAGCQDGRVLVITQFAFPAQIWKADGAVQQLLVVRNRLHVLTKEPGSLTALDLQVMWPTPVVFFSSITSATRLSTSTPSLLLLALSNGYSIYNIDRLSESSK